MTISLADLQAALAACGVASAIEADLIARSILASANADQNARMIVDAANATANEEPSEEAQQRYEDWQDLGRGKAGRE